MIAVITTTTMMMMMTADEGFNGNGHIIHNRTPISERTARVSSSSYYSDIEEDAVNEEEYKIKANLLKC